MVSQEDFDGIRAAQKAITKLEGGSSIISGSDEHQQLTWAVIRLSNLLLTRPMTEKDLERAKEVAQRYFAGKITAPITDKDA
jgi:hypothetical protein